MPISSTPVDMAMAADMAGLTTSSMPDAEATAAAAAARNAYARHTDGVHATPTRRPSRKSRTSQGSHFEIARRRSTRSTTSPAAAKQDQPATVLVIASGPIPEAVASSPAPSTVDGRMNEKPAQVVRETTSYLTPTTETQAARAVQTQTQAPTPRHFSAAIKGRLKQVFRKIPPAPVLPPAPPPSPDAAPVHEPPLATPPNEPEPQPEPYATRPFSISTKSRVTSWTNSTIAAVSSIRSNQRTSRHFDPPSEPVLELNSRGLRKRSSFFVASVRHRAQDDALTEPMLGHDARELRKKTSFFGAPVRNKLHRGSRAELKGSSEESAGLYSALQKRIRPAKSECPINREGISTPCEESTLEGTTFFEPSLPTIRTITPDHGICTISVPSPVREVKSPASSLRRRSALRVPHASRPDAISPSVYSRATDGASLRPLSPEGDEGTSTIVITGREVRRYSISPAKPGGGHRRGNGSGSWRKWLSDEMRTSLGTGGPQYQSLNVPTNEQYMQARRTPSPAMQMLAHRDVSPAKSHVVHHGAQGSGSWRKWLSDEMKTTLGNNDQQFRLLNSAASRPHSISPLSDPGDEIGRPRSRASSVVSAMNDRYPRVVPTHSCFQDYISPPTLRAPSRSSYQEASRPLTRQSHQEPSRAATSHGQQDHARLASINRSLHAYSSKENVRPASMHGRPPASPLPALSSSQWLATGAHKKQQGEQRKTSLKDALAKPSISRVSARDSVWSMRDARDGSAKPTLSRESMIEMRDRSRRSPGQHMVTDWLEERKSRDSLGKRAELEGSSVGGSAFL